MIRSRFAVINFYLYTFLLIVTPFLMLQNYLQSAIGSASRAEIASSIPLMPVLGIMLALTIIFLARKHLSRKRIMHVGVALLLVAAGQMTSDYYFGHRYYDLQHNWHYIAYGIFSFIAYRRFGSGKFQYSRIILRIFIMALVISCFDEIIQIFISDRIFDLSDVAKDLWGCMIGMYIIFFVIESGKAFGDHRIRHKKLKEYVKHPFSVLFHCFILSYILLFTSSVLTDASYWLITFALSILFYLPVFLLIHLTTGKKSRIAAAILILIFAGFVASVSFSKNKNLRYVSSDLILYNGFPLWYFDFMIYENGWFRPVDKKSFFNVRDKQKIDMINPDILLLGTGKNGKGGKGWNDHKEMEFRYNNIHKRAYQIIKMPTPAACREYGRLKSEGLNVLFIIHND